MSDYKFSNKEKVTFVYGGMNGFGEVIGVATTELPILGSFYIVKVLWSDSDAVNNHPFNVITIPEINLVSIKMGSTPEKIDGHSAYKVFIGDNPVPLLQLKQKFVWNLRDMPNPERQKFIEVFLDDLIATTVILEYIEEAHLRNFIRAILSGVIY